MELGEVKAGVMEVSRSWRVIPLALAVGMIAAGAGLVGCGSGGSNDQGLSFRVFGVFLEIEEKVPPEADKLTTVENHPGDGGRVMSFSNRTHTSVPTDINGDGDLDGGYIGFENVMTTQRLNVTGIDVRIEIPGATIPLPTDFVNVALTLDRKVGVDDEPGLGNIALTQVVFVSNDIITFLANNRNKLPPTPFEMIVVMTAEAVGDTGDRFVSNEFTYRVTFVD